MESPGDGKYQFGGRGPGWQSESERIVLPLTNVACVGSSCSLPAPAEIKSIPIHPLCFLSLGAHFNEGHGYQTIARESTCQKQTHGGSLNHNNSSSEPKSLQEATQNHVHKSLFSHV